jgi:hypothetical protein
MEQLRRVLWKLQLWYVKAAKHDMWMRRIKEVCCWHSLASLNLSLHPHCNFFLFYVTKGEYCKHKSHIKYCAWITGSGSYGAPPTAYGTSSYGQTTYGGSSDYGGQALGSSDSKRISDIVGSRNALLVYMGFGRNFVRFWKRLLVVCIVYWYFAWSFSCVCGEGAVHLCAWILIVLCHLFSSKLNQGLWCGICVYSMQLDRFVLMYCKIFIRMHAPKITPFTWSGSRVFPDPKSASAHTRRISYDVYVLWHVWSNMQITLKTMRRMAQSMPNVSCRLYVCVYVYIYTHTLITHVCIRGTEFAQRDLSLVCVFALHLSFNVS